MESLGKLERRSLLRFSEKEEEISTGSRKNSVNSSRADSGKELTGETYQDS